MNDAENHVFINELLHDIHQCNLQRNEHRTINITFTNGDTITIGYPTIANPKNKVTYANGTTNPLELACSIVHPNVPDSHPVAISMRIYDEQNNAQVLRLNHVTYYTVSPGNYT